MPQKNSFGSPSITGNSIEELKKSTQFWVQQLFNHLDTLAGLRGNAAFYGPVDAQGFSIRHVGDPEDESGAVPLRLVLHKNAQGHFDTGGLQIVAPAGNATNHVANVGQVAEAIVAQTSLLAARLPPTTARETYVVTNYTPQRSFDAVAGTLPDALNTLATLIQDLRVLGFVL